MKTKNKFHTTNKKNQSYFPYIVNKHFSEKEIKEEIKEKENQILSLPREVLKWIHLLDLTYPIKNIKKDFNNGFLIGQIYNRYFPDIFQMHSLDNGLSYMSKLNNWILIDQFIKKIPEVHTASNPSFWKRKEISKFANENMTNEILIYIIDLYEELTKKKLDYKVKVYTDVDNINKSFILNSNGDPEPVLHNLNNVSQLSQINMISSQSKEVKKEEVNQTDINKGISSQSKQTGSLSKTQKDTYIMKGEQKPISQTMTKTAERNFNIKFTEPKIYERNVKVLRQIKDNQNDSFNKTQKTINQNQANMSMGNIQEEIKNQALSEFLPEETEKQTKNKYPFDVIENDIQMKISKDYQADYKIINSMEDRFLFNYFKNINLISIGSLEMTLNEISTMIDKYYNILSEQSNEYISLIYLLFDSYVNTSNTIEDFPFEDNKKTTKFYLFHKKLIKDFFPKCQKNKSEEMNSLFRHVIIERLFELMNMFEYEEKFLYFCEILFFILDPWDNQQFNFIKLIKENLTREELIYDCLGYFHLIFNKNFSESFVDASLFYVINGINSEFSKIRYNSLVMILTYVSNISINFFYNFELILEKMSLNEDDVENNLILIQILISVITQKQKSKENPLFKKNLTNSLSENKGDDENFLVKDSGDQGNVTKYIKNIMIRLIGNDVFMVISLSIIGNILYENQELYKTFVYSLIRSNETVMESVFYKKKINPKLEMKLQYSNFKSNPDFNSNTIDWNYGSIFKAYSQLLQNGIDTSKGNITLKENYDSKRRITYLRDKDYDFIVFCIGESLNPMWSENWKISFVGFSKYVIQDLLHPEKCERSMKIIEKFLMFEPIQKQICDNIYEQLALVLKEILTLRLDVCYNKINEYLVRFSQSHNCGSILKDSLRRLMDIK